ncbi:hypothetical protein ASPZODRAFT_93002 [Penicilliopsis zonata CBS 506.65]|uniref:Mmc1 C-terminal domain-containing protein n=1 Tax=Penicilliopsis zonata CBS 506.65 TaxID=1073090 RepID=A0A1L9SMC1_9EURO|nr:hypothetical protein ASPZODRAFT_93002 [Penicilliopsis zonata CBS 506.65]OJJ48409.1 hypothetical protein ASPZODRAFT_93002 [Penicilliopsis zonata CBS 506.65]
MPPKLRGSLSRSFARPADPTGVFYCPSCAVWRRAATTRSSGNSDNHSRGRGSPSTSASTVNHRSIATSPGINALRNVPARFRELYEALDRVRAAAPEQVNLSRMHLALRGLESETPVVRVAVLGLNDATAARRLVRLLLADPLNPREDWEDILDGHDEDFSRGLLIRYGEASQTLPGDLLPTITVPSPALRKGNIEILVSTIGTEGGRVDAEITADTFLVPTIAIPTSHSGRYNVIRNPVHKTLVCGKGADGLLAYSSMFSRAALKADAGLVRGAIELAVADKTGTGNDRLAFVDIEKAEVALAKFRESVRNASEYERGWNTSGVQPILDWLSSSSSSQPKGHEDGGLNPLLESLIVSLLDSTAAKAATQEAVRAKEIEEAAIPDTVRQNLELSVTAWAEKAHTELRDSLEEGFASKRWKGLSWWKLFWRVDDVAMITSEILEKKYLQQAETEVIYTAGKLQQAGLLDMPEKQQSAFNSSIEEAGAERTEENPALPPEIPPWPTHVTTSRARLLNETVPSLQALAQNLVLFSASTTTLTSALSALTYVSFPVTTVSEACTFAAVGFIYSLRRQQKKWDTAREFWETEVREEGRTALLETEASLRHTVSEGGLPRTDDVPGNKMRESIDRARTALAQVK